MNEKISRNDPCPCGSGKKYKKCCGIKEAVSIMHIIESEMDDLQKQILQFAFNYYGNEMDDDYEDLRVEMFTPDEEGDQFFELVHSIWFSLFAQLDDGETIIKKFVANEGPRIKRPKLKQILQSWVNPRIITGKVISTEKNKIVVEDAFTLEKVETLIITDHFPVETDTFLVGMLLPYDQNFVFFPGPFEMKDVSVVKAVDLIENNSLDAEYDSPQEYLTHFFIETVNELLMVGQDVDLDGMDWPEPIYQEVAEIFQGKFESVGESSQLMEIGVILWYQFCQKRKKKIQNPSIYAAAIHYLISTVIPMEIAHTQKELGNLYGVSANSISTAFNTIEHVLSAEITELLEGSNDHEIPKDVQFNRQQGSMVTERAMQEVITEIQEQNFGSVEEINQFLNQRLNEPKKIPQGNKERARDLIYNAFEAVGNRRYKLAEQALKLDPDCVDAYVIAAENADSLEEALTWYEKGMMIGEEELGKAFFMENMGHFWGLLETRPFMRAKFNYAMTLYDLGKISVATQHYEEMLRLNPNDNQGVRNLLFIAYSDLSQFKMAHKLLLEYGEQTAQGLYNTTLLELLEKGCTPKAAKLFKEAKKQNKYVVPYLTGKKRLPANQPDYYGFGDENEAIIYVSEHLHLWQKIKGLLEWIKGQ